MGEDIEGTGDRGQETACSQRGTRRLLYSTIESDVIRSSAVIRIARLTDKVKSTLVIIDGVGLKPNEDLPETRAKSGASMSIAMSMMYGMDKRSVRGHDSHVMEIPQRFKPSAIRSSIGNEGLV